MTELVCGIMLDNLTDAIVFEQHQGQRKDQEQDQYRSTEKIKQ
jgi:hypothetical protein